MTVIERLNIIFQEVFNDDTIIIHDKMVSFDVDGWDSFAHLNIIMCIEAEFGVMITDQEAPKLKNIGDMIKIVQFKIERNSSCIN